LSPDDIRVGPLVFGNLNLAATPAGLREFYGGNGQVPDGPDGSKFYKMGTQVQANSTGTLSVTPKAISYLRLQQGQWPAVPETAVTFLACRGTGYTGWVGGFDIKGGVPTCIALGGEPRQALGHVQIDGTYRGWHDLNAAEVRGRHGARSDWMTN
jgi:hypothetical protein